MKIIEWYYNTVHCPVTWAIERRFGYYSKVAKIFRRFGHKITRLIWRYDYD